MSKVIEIFDETKKKYIRVNAGSDRTCRLDDSDLKRIELELIRYADRTCHRAYLMGQC